MHPLLLRSKARLTPPTLVRSLGVCAAGAVLFGQARDAQAFTIDSPVTAGCHEEITTDAVRILRAKLPEGARVAPVGDERFLADSVPFSVEGDMHDTGSLALLIANRDVDLEGGRATDATRLSQIHSNPATQDHHCLRAAGDDEPDGAARAIAACRLHIRSKALEAASHAGADGALDPAKRVPHRTDIAYRGPVEVTLPPARRSTPCKTASPTRTGRPMGCASSRC